MSISGVGNGADLLGVVSQLAQGATAQDASMNVLKTAQDASMNVLKTALDASASEASGLASLISQVTGSGSLLNTYA